MIQITPQMRILVAIEPQSTSPRQSTLRFMMVLTRFPTVSGCARAEVISPQISPRMPSFSCISSSGTPLVSGTAIFTQMSCSTIMPQKNTKT